MKLAGIRQWYNDHYENTKLRRRLRELIWSRGLTEQDICSALEIDPETWINVSKGIRRPSHTFVCRLMEILGDEVQLLFMGYYMDNESPKLIPADQYEQDSATRIMQEKIKDVQKRNGKFVYLSD